MRFIFRQLNKPLQNISLSKTFNRTLLNSSLQNKDPEIYNLIQKEVEDFVGKFPLYD